jgi:transcriptional regulator with XRE-family HTH domain
MYMLKYICMLTDTVKMIGHKLREARQRAGMTQAELATKAGTNTNYYAKLERGEATPSLNILEKIVKALDVKSSDILPF